MRRRALTFVVWLCTAASVVVVPSAAGDELEHKRDDARRRESEARRQLDLARATEADLSGRLAEIASDLAKRRSEAEAARADVEEASRTLARITADMAELRERLAQRRADFNRRAVLAYMGGEGRPLDELNLAGELLSLPEEFADAARRTELVSLVAHQDGHVLVELTEAQAALSRQELVLTQTRKRAAARAADAERAVEAVAALKREEEATRGALQAKIVELSSEIDALAAEQARLEAMIRERLAAAAARAREAQRRGPFAGRRTGKGVSIEGFVWPVDGYVTSGYGPRWGRMHTGIDIAAPAGTPIGAAKEGEVIYAEWLGGYGNLVAVDHGGSVVTLYAHQSRMAVAEGQLVGQGEVLGYVGTTGRSTGNHLHFEIRVDAEPRDPRPYLP